MYQITKKEILSAGVIRMEIVAPAIAKAKRAGQFVILKINERGERIPLTIVSSDDKEISIIFQIVGKTTIAMANMAVGDSFQDVQGPLGNPTEIENYGHSVCVGGGVGVGVVYPLAVALKEKGNRVTSIIGARNKELLILEKEMKQVSDRLFVTSDDGSYGVKGFVSDVLRKMIDDGVTINRVFAIGPVPMMRSICRLTEPYKIKTIVSLNPIMVDGTGMCGACRVSVGGKTKFTCVDGPEFDGHEVDFDLLNNRLKMYLAEEKQAVETCECGCHGK
ncbi:MAG: sulfide/dihydroorotate dehydrogenase-like FAD/NAD-binding protein [Deltaproteobacteria bacterium]|nr:sulfide/dihydroorotate dehydrogenase-like FAD/NAD-binding protein [Deltaproteobacteria bacterium]